MFNDEQHSIEVYETWTMRDMPDKLFLNDRKPYQCTYQVSDTRFVSMIGILYYIDIKISLQFKRNCWNVNCWHYFW